MGKSKTWGSWLIRLGILIIALSIIWITLIEPKYEKLPTDLDETFLIDATVQYVALGENAPKTPVTIERHQWATGDKDGALYISEELKFNPEIPAVDFLNTTYTMSVDRSSREYVSAPDYEDREREALWGYPIGVKKKDYVLWSDTARSAPYARYDGEDEIAGLDVYTFITDEKDIERDSYFIDLVIEEKVEPCTGITVYGKSTRTVKNQAGETPALVVITQEYSTQTTAEKVSDAKHYKTQLLWATQYGLWIGFGLGAIWILAGAFLFVRAKKSGGKPENSTG
ncbi:MAG: porin PorA family protein [Dehalococcoidia bacterium]|nr:porin PorA family protein [Dehalococcoidia bacterium]